MLGKPSDFPFLEKIKYIEVYVKNIILHIFKYK